MATTTTSKNSDVWLQLVINFVLPLLVLNQLSAENKLGPTWAFMAALAFPLVYEIYRWRNKQKLSMLSLVAVGGILVTGLIGFLGLSEGWLALRRSIPYAAAGGVLYILATRKHPIIEKLMPKLFNMELVQKAAKKKKVEHELQHKIHLVGKLFSVLLFVIAGISYVTTRIVISAPANTVAYTQEYARLRVLSIVTISLPLLIGTIGLVTYLVGRVEKLTGLSAEQILGKKS